MLKKYVFNMWMKQQQQDQKQSLVLVWTVSRLPIIFCADLWHLWGACDFLPERTAAPAVEAKGGKSPVMLLAFLDTDMWKMSRLILAAIEKYPIYTRMSTVQSNTIKCKEYALSIFYKCKWTFKSQYVLLFRALESLLRITSEIELDRNVFKGKYLSTQSDDRLT